MTEEERVEILRPLIAALVRLAIRRQQLADE